MTNNLIQLLRTLVIRPAKCVFIIFHFNLLMPYYVCGTAKIPFAFLHTHFTPIHSPCIHPCWEIITNKNKIQSTNLENFIYFVYNFNYAKLSQNLMFPDRRGCLTGDKTDKGGPRGGKQACGRIWRLESTGARQLIPKNGRKFGTRVNEKCSYLVQTFRETGMVINFYLPDFFKDTTW